MSNVIHASVDYSGPDKQAVVGKIYEDLYQDSDGNVSVRYIRLIKATAAVAAGQLCSFVKADAPGAYTLGEAKPVPIITSLPVQQVAGVAVAAIASGEFGFVVCRGVVEGVKAGAGIAIGDLLEQRADGEVDTVTLAAGTSGTVVGIALTATASNAINAYINVL